MFLFRFYYYYYNHNHLYPRARIYMQYKMVIEYQYVLTSSDVPVVISRIIVFFILFETIFQLLLKFLPEQPKLFDSKSKLTPGRFRTAVAINCICVVHAAFGSAVAIYALFYDAAMYDILQHCMQFNYDALYEKIFLIQESTYCSFLVTMCVGYFTWDLYNYRIQEVFEFVMILHHLISIIVWPIATCYGLGNFFLLYFIATEFSSPLIHVRWYLRSIYGKKIEWLIATVTFVLVFTFARIITMPYVLFGLYASNTWQHSSLPFWLRLISTSTLYLPCLLNMYWFLYILKMCTSFLCDSKKKEKET